MKYVCHLWSHGTLSFRVLAAKSVGDTGTGSYYGVWEDYQHVPGFVWKCPGRYRSVYQPVCSICFLSWQLCHSLQEDLWNLQRQHDRVCKLYLFGAPCVSVKASGLGSPRRWQCAGCHLHCCHSVGDWAVAVDGQDAVAISNPCVWECLDSSFPGEPYSVLSSCVWFPLCRRTWIIVQAEFVWAL